MKNLTVGTATKYIEEQDCTPRHNMEALVKACRRVGKREKVSPANLFKLLCFNNNTVIGGTHSYGFHTRYGRHLIDTTIGVYYQVERELSEEEVLIF